MKFLWSEKKNEANKTNPNKCGFGFEVAAKIFGSPYVEAMKNDDPEQFLAIGLVQNQLISVVFEYREDETTGEEFIWLVTYYKSSKKEAKIYEETI